MPDKDLWIQILNRLVAAGPGLFSIVKVKSFQAITDALNVRDAWTMLGNAKADQHAKAALHLFQNSQPPEWKQESICRVPGRRGAPQPDEPTPPPAVPVNQVVATSLFYEPPPLVDVPAQYDRPWLQLVQHYFSFLVWRPANDPGQLVSLLELLFDLLCTFQIPMPRDLIGHKKVPFPGVEVPRIRKYFYLFPASQGKFLPPVTLKESLCLFSQTILWLNRLGPLAPCSTERVYSGMLSPLLLGSTSCRTRETLLSLSVCPDGCSATAS